MLYAELSHCVPCVSRQFSTEKKFPQFSIFYFSKFVQEAFAMEWTLLTTTAYDDMLSVEKRIGLSVFSYFTSVQPQI